MGRPAHGPVGCPPKWGACESVTRARRAAALFTFENMLLSRRSLLRSGALLAAAGSVGGALAPLGSRPGPAREFVLWGSSSAASALARDRPPGFPEVRIDVLLSRLLEVPGTSRAVSGDVSSQTLALRSREHPYRVLLGRGGLPAHGTVVVPTADGRAPSALVAEPGTVAGVGCTIRGVRGREGVVALHRVVPGAALAPGTGPQSWWRTALQEAHRGQVHLVWTGKNNIAEHWQVLADTRAIWAVEPERTVVMGHWHTWRDRRGTARWEQVRAVNAAYRHEYGQRFYDTMADLRDPRLWALPALRPHRIGSSAEDRRWLAQGLPPRSVVAADRAHLNALGNTVLAHGLARFLTGPAGLY